MTAYVIRYVEPVGVIVVDDDAVPPGAFLSFYDPDGGDPSHPIVGEATWTLDLADAMQFPDAAAALACYRATSVRAPLRDDGKPNRPLTAVTVSIEPVP
jgi:hypothetical protein